MNRLCMTSLLALLAAGASAQANAPAKPAAPGAFPARVNMRADAIKEFDKDGDGKLNEEERKAMMAARMAMGEKLRMEREKKFDKDGDGKLSDEERKAMMEAMQKRRPNAGPQFQEMMKKFDKDGDGKLNEEERKAMREARLNAPAQPKPAAPAAAAK